ncbi:MAG: hypothetical protein ACR2M7_04300, partial [Bdellovibrionales bacterium]
MAQITKGRDFLRSSLSGTQHIVLDGGIGTATLNNSSIIDLSELEYPVVFAATVAPDIEALGSSVVFY